MLLDYFGDSKVFKTEAEAFEQAKKLYKEVEWTEYGINFIRGWEDKEFPKMEV